MSLTDLQKRQERKIRKSGFSFQSEKHPFMLANVDRLIVGEKAGLECKTASALTRCDFENGDIPPSYYCQCMHYMAVTGFEKWYIAVLVMGKGFFWYEINRNEEEIEALIKAEGDFWEMVKQGNARRRRLRKYKEHIEHKMAVSSKKLCFRA